MQHDSGGARIGLMRAGPGGGGIVTLKLIGAGLGRTGTASLRLALRQIEYRCYHMYDIAFDRARRKDVDFWNTVIHGNDSGAEWNTIFGDFQATLDYPGCFFWRELMVAYPKAKVVLTTHPRGAEAWYDSTYETIFADTSTVEASAFGRAIVVMLDRHVWGPEGFFRGRFQDRDYAIARYEEHSEDVRKGVPAERLIDYSVTQGWEPICTALGTPIPEQPFPTVNEREEKARMVRRLERMTAFGLGKRKADESQPENIQRSTKAG